MVSEAQHVAKLLPRSLLESADEKGLRPFLGSFTECGAGKAVEDALFAVAGPEDPGVHFEEYQRCFDRALLALVDLGNKVIQVRGIESVPCRLEALGCAEPGVMTFFRVVSAFDGLADKTVGGLHLGGALGDRAVVEVVAGLCPRSAPEHV